MKLTPVFEFSVDRENNSISVQREFDAPLAVVWDAYTKSEILDQWWAPKPWKARTKSMDFREGGRWIYAMAGPEGEEHWAVADYKKIEPQKMFSGLDAFADANGNVNKDMPQSEWKVKFFDKGQTTLVTIDINYGSLSQLEETIKMGFKDGLRIAMEGLDDLLEHRDK